MSKKPLDARYISTPIGAAIGVALTRKLIPREDLTIGKQIAGGGLGAAAGYAVGSGIEGSKVNKSRYETGIRGYQDYLKNNLISGDISDDELKMVEGFRPVTPSKEEFDSMGYTQKAVALNRAKRNSVLNVYKAREELFIDAARSEKDPSKKAKYLLLADKALQSYDRIQNTPLNFMDDVRVGAVAAGKSTGSAIIDGVLN